MNIKCDTRKELGPQQFYLDKEIGVKDAVEMVCVHVKTEITSVETLNGEARCNYIASYSIIYKDSQGNYKGETKSFDEVQVIKSQDIKERSYLDVHIGVLTNEYVGQKQLKIRSTLELKGFTIVPKNIETIDNDNNYNQKTFLQTIEDIIPISRSEFIANKKSDCKHKVDEFVMSDAKVMIDKVSTATDICEIEGVCYLQTIAIADNNIISDTIKIPFQTEILASKVKANDEVFLEAFPLSINFTSEGELGYSVEAVIGVKGFCINKTEVQLIDDIYSIDKEIKATKQQCIVEQRVCLNGINEKFFGSVRIDEGEQRLRSVLAVCPPSLGTINASNDGTLIAEGIVSTMVIVLDEDGKVLSLPAEIPYRYVLSRDYECKDKLFPKANIYGLSAKVRHNDEIEITGEINIEVYGSEEKVIDVITNVEVLGDKEKNDAVISLYIVEKGETLWDVAKCLSTSEDILLKLNPDLVLPLEGGENVILM